MYYLPALTSEQLWLVLRIKYLLITAANCGKLLLFYYDLPTGNVSLKIYIYLDFINSVVSFDNYNDDGSM